MDDTSDMHRAAPRYRVIAAFLMAMTLAGTALADPIGRDPSDIARMYSNSQGVDYAEAAKGNRKLADQGFAEAQYNLGLMYADGLGVPQDYVVAQKWLILAASRFTTAPQAQLRDQAVARRDEVAAKMTPQQIAKAQKLAGEWKPTKGVEGDYCTLSTQCDGKMLCINLQCGYLVKH
jgi:TPR repeat protein